MILRRLPILLTIGGLLLLMTAHLLAQSQANEAIPACSPEEITAILQVLNIDAANLDNVISSSVETPQFFRTADKPTLEQAVGQIDQAQRELWSQTAPKLPRCSLAIELTLSRGRAIDELLIAVSLTLSGHNDLAETHFEQYLALVKQEVDLLKDVLGAGEVAPTAVPTMSADTQAAGVKPKAGKWEGSSGGKATEKVSFTVTEQGAITDFEMQIKTSGGDTCTVTSEEVLPDSSGAFTISVTVGGETGIVIEARFDSETTLGGNYSELVVCDDGSFIFNLVPEDRTWTAEWKSP